MSTPAIQYQGPAISPEVPWEIGRHLQLFYQKIANQTQGISLLKQQIDSIKAGSSTTTSIVEGGTSGGGSSSQPGIPVNNQSGVTSYATAAGDNGTLILFSDASPIAVSLTTQDAPWGACIANIGALGSGTVTLTPATGTINGAATLAILPTYFAIVAFDGNNWWAATLPIVPINTPSVAHEWLNSYNATTGAFTATQPAFADISGTLATSQLPADVPVVSFGAGAPSGTSTEGYIYFNTSVSPYNGYVYHSGAWEQFS